MGVTIRLMTIDDYTQVRSLWESCAGMGLRDADDSAEGIGVLLARNPSTCFVAENDGEVVGSILAGHDGRRAHLYHVAVSPQCRRQGIARALVEAAIDALQREGIRKVATVAFETNTDGNRFWESMGFTVRHDLVYRDKALELPLG